MRRPSPTPPLLLPLLLAILAALCPAQSFREARSTWRKARRAEALAERQPGVDALVASGDPRVLDDLLDELERVDSLLAKLEARVERVGPEINKAWRGVDKQAAAGRPVTVGTAESAMKKAQEAMSELDRLAQLRRREEEWRDRIVRACAALLTQQEGEARKEALEELTRPLERGRDEEEARRRIAVLGALEIPEARAILTGVITGSDASGRRVSAIDALARHRDGSPGVVAALKGALDDETLPVRIAAARALGRLPSLQAIPALVARLERAEGRLIEELLDALEDLAGRSYADNAVLWKEWWKKEGEALDARLKPLREGELDREALQAVADAHLGVGIPLILRAAGLDPLGGSRSAEKKQAELEEGELAAASDAVAGALRGMKPRLRKRALGRYLVRPLLREDDPAVRARWLGIAGRTDDERILSFALSAARATSAGEEDATGIEALRVAALRALGHQSDPKSTPERPINPIIVRTLRRYARQSTEPTAVRAAAVAALETRSTRPVEEAREAVKGLIALNGEGDPELSALCGPALERATGLKHADPAAWTAWWRKAGEEWKPGALADGPERPQEEDASRKTGFFGIPSRSKHVVYILDRSGSMTAHDGASGKQRIDVAKEELLKAIRGLPEDGTFNIVFYNHEFATWQRKMTPATPRARKAAERWVKAIDAVGNTNIFDPLEHAFQMAGRGTFDRAYHLELDTIYFLSDGQPNRGRIVDPRQILEEVRRMNALKKVKIHTIGIGTGGGGMAGHDAAFMRALAELSGGTYIAR